MNAGTRSFAVQCQSRKSTGVQTKRLSKEELRYYTKIVDKEKQVLLDFLKATKEYPQIRQPHYRVNLFPTQTKYRKNSGTRKKRKRKHSKHSSHKTKLDLGKTRHEREGDQENSGHYVSKIVVDDATHCLKLRVRSYNPKKGSSMHELKENKNLAVPPERTRSRKAKQPRRFNRSLESLTEELENNHGGLKEVENKSSTAKMEPRSLCQQPLSFKHNRETTSPKEIINPEKITNDENEINLEHLPLCSTTLADKPIVKDEVENTDCLFANTKLGDHLSSPASSSPPTMTTQLTPVFPTGPSDDESSDRQATSSSDDSNYHSQDEDSDDNQSVCSEEFFIVEGNSDSVDDVKEIPDITVIESGAEANSADTMITEQTDTNLKDELKTRLKGNLVRKAVDNEQSDSENKTNGAENKTNMAENKNNTTGKEPKNLPHVVSVHFYDPQTHSQREVGADTHITQYPSYTMVQNPKTSSTTLLYPKVPPLLNRAPNSPRATMPSNIPQDTLPRLPPMNCPSPSFHRNTTEISNQRPTYHIPGIPSIISTKVRTLAPGINSKSTTTRGVESFDASTPAQVRLDHPELPTKSAASHGVASATFSDSTEVLRSQRQSEILTNGIIAPEASISSGNVPTDVAIHQPELSSNNTLSRGVAPYHKSSISPEEAEKFFKETESKKRKRFIFGSHEPPKKKVISSLLTPLCEREATRLADGIHEINMQYFPLRSLAQKAANRVSEDTDDVLKLIDQKIQLKTKIQDVEKARNLLKDIYDMVLKSKEIEDIQNFELVSHNFGVRNILNHLSLVDLYFGELGTELQSKI